MIFANLSALLENHNKTERFIKVFGRKPDEYMQEYGYSSELIIGILDDLQIEFKGLEVSGTTIKVIY